MMATPITGRRCCHQLSTLQSNAVLTPSSKGTRQGRPCHSPGPEGLARASLHSAQVQPPTHWAELKRRQLRHSCCSIGVRDSPDNHSGLIGKFSWQTPFPSIINTFWVKSSHVQESFNLHATIYISNTIYTPELQWASLSKGREEGFQDRAHLSKHPHSFKL